MTAVGNYTLGQRTLSALKSAVKRAQNRCDWDAVIEICDKAEAKFKEHGYPDCWADFIRHRDDAAMHIRHKF